MSIPKITIICTSYNHADYIGEALESIVFQEIPRLELFIIDNGSNDSSQKIIQEWALANEKLTPKLILRKGRINYCKSFNEALNQCTGDFIIDLAGDDALLQGHVDKAVAQLIVYPEAAVCFSDALIVKEDIEKRFYEMNRYGPPVDQIGDVYGQVIDRYCISTATMVFRASHLKAIGGYDEELVYEDFDVLCRLARRYPFCFSPHLGIKKRILPTAFAAGQYSTKNSQMLKSTLEICHKIKRQNKSKQEDTALHNRLMHETKHALGSANFEAAEGFLKLADEIKISSPRTIFFKLWLKSRVDLSRLYQWMK